MNEFLAYTDTLVPTFRHSIAGATADEMRELAAYAGPARPPMYDAYFAHMGRSDGGLRPVLDGKSTISAVLDWYRRGIMPGRTSIPEGCILVAVGIIAFDCLCIDISEDGRARVRYTSGTERRRLLAESMEHLLYRNAFVALGWGTLPHRGVWYNETDDGMVDVYGRQFEEWRFERHWFSDEVGFCGERPGARVYVQQIEGQAAIVQLASSSEGELAGLGALLETRHGLVR